MNRWEIASPLRLGLILGLELEKCAETPEKGEMKITHAGDISPRMKIVLTLFSIVSQRCNDGPEAQKRKSVYMACLSNVSAVTCCMVEHG